jgi:hypothetical protein
MKGRMLLGMIGCSVGHSGGRRWLGPRGDVYAVARRVVSRLLELQVLQALLEERRALLSLQVNNP